MMNLLIAVISDTYDRVASSNVGYDNIEKIDLILGEEYILRGG